MAAPRSAQITQLLARAADGDRLALDSLMPLVEQELHRLAVHYMAGERPGHVLQATALVNEAYVRLVNWDEARWQNRAHFYAMAAQIMRRVLVDEARGRKRQRRGGGHVRVSLSEAAALPAVRSNELLALDDALRSLESLDPRKARVIELRYFGGLSLEEAAEVMGMSISTVRRDWSFSRAWLARELAD